MMMWCRCKAVSYIDAGEPLFAAIPRVTETYRAAVTADVAAVRKEIYDVYNMEEMWECLTWEDPSYKD